MLALALCLSLGQLPDAPFRHATESFVHTTGRVHRYDQVLCPADARLLRVLACPSFDARELARSMLAVHPDSFRVCYWGSRSHDAETATVCRDLLYRCRACNGSGICSRCRESSVPGCPCIRRGGHSDISKYWECPACGGTGELRW